MTEKGKIVFKQQGMITTYECTCGGNVEPCEIGAFCECGASKGWD